MRPRPLAFAICAVLAAGACGQNGAPSDPAGSGAWRELAASPLAPRERATGVWTGREALLIGGSDQRPCPENADCPVDATPRSDGAALDPRTGRWRRVADAPVPLLAAATAVVGQVAYVLPAPSFDRPVRDEVLRYDIAGDRWTRVATPFRLDANYALLAAGDVLVAYATSDEVAAGPDFALDAGARSWRRLPADPLGPSFDRTMAWTGREVVAFDKELVADPGATRPSVTRAAVLDLARSRWRRLPDSEILASSPWLADGDRLVNPTLGGSDGGQVGNYGRVYPYGGVLDAAAGRWEPLPDAPAVDGPAEHRSGAIGTASAVYPEAAGAVLDTVTGRWLSIPEAPGGEMTGRTVVAAGRDLLVFGGAAWRSQEAGTLVNRAWLWPPPR
jgi:hypothetical protein